MTVNTPKLELKNLKYAEFASEETPCYEATVYVDGARFCIASNQGQGGPDSYDVLRPKGGFKTGEEAGAARRELEEDLHLVGLRHNPNAKRMWDEAQACQDELTTGAVIRNEDWDERYRVGPDVTTLGVFEHLVMIALTEALYAKDMKSAMSKKWLFRKTPDGSLFECRRLKGQNAEKMLEVIRCKNPEAVLLNALPTSEALEIWRANG